MTVMTQEERRDLVVQFLTATGGSTIEEVAYHYTGEGKQSLFNPVFRSLEKDHVIRKSGKMRKTTNGGDAMIYKIRVRSRVNVDKTKARFKSADHEARVMDISWEEACVIQEWLFNKANRDVNPAGVAVKELVGQMEAGNFNPWSMIMFADDGTLLEGHHRITAQVISGIDATYCVQLGGKFEWVPTVDIGRRRSTRDTAQMVFRLLGKEVTGVKAATLSSIATHFLANNKPTGVTITGSGCSNLEVYEWVNNHAQYCEEVIDTLELLKANPSVPDFKEIFKRPLKRATVVAFAEMFDKDASFTFEYFSAIFGKHSLGVFSGTTASAVKSEYNRLVDLAEKKKITREVAERQLYTILVNGHNALKGVKLGDLDGRYSNLKPSSAHLLKKDGDNIVNTVRPI